MRMGTEAETIFSAILLAIDTAWNSSEEVDFEFNGIPLRVNGYSYSQDILSIYNLKCKIRQLESRY